MEPISMVAIVLAVLVPLAGVPMDLPSHPDLIVGGIGDGSNVIVPAGLTQINGNLYQLAPVLEETGLYLGGAYTDVIETGLFVGGGY